MLGNVPDQLSLKTSHHFRHNFLNKSQSIIFRRFSELEIIKNSKFKALLIFTYCWHISQF